MSSKRVIVCGASGLLGKACLPVLVERDWEVIGVCSRLPERQRSGPITWKQVDLRHQAAVQALLRDARASHLLHAAWKPVHGDVMGSPENLLWLRASLALVEAFQQSGGRRAAVIGSCAEYDWSSGLCRNGVTPLRPSTLYGACKHALQVALSAYAHTTGLELVWPRVFFVYGPHEHETRLVAHVVRALLRGEPATCTEGRQERDYLHVSDVARGIVAALESSHDGPIDIASGQRLAVRDLVLQVGAQLGKSHLLRLGALSSPPDLAPLVLGDADEARRTLNWQPLIGLTEGIADTIAWGRQTFLSAPA